MRKVIFVLTVFTFCFIAASNAQIVNHWRGPDRSGIYHEKGLLKEWPADGPEINWVYEELGRGYSSPVIVNGRIFVSGMEGGEGYIYVLGLDGKPERKIGYGPERPEDYPGSRVSPTIVNDLMYMVSAFGVLSCIEVNTGNIRWKKNLFDDLDGDNIRWGYTENLWIDGDKVYCTPGGKRHNVVALNRHSGEIIWSSPGQGDLSAYNSPLLFEHNGRKILATHMAKNVVGFDANTGQMLWNHPFVNTWDVHPNTPIYHDGGIFFYSGYGQGGIKFNLSADGSKIAKAWESKTFDVQLEGAVLYNGYIYGSGQNNRFWFCVDWKTGENKWQSRDLAKGNVIIADDMLFIYSDRGELALAKPLPDSFNVISQTRVTHGSEQHWAHLVINNGVLYVRHGNALIAYKVK